MGKRWAWYIYTLMPAASDRALRMANLVVRKDRASWVTRVEHPEPRLPRQRCVLEGEAPVIVNHYWLSIDKRVCCACMCVMYKQTHTTWLQSLFITVESCSILEIADNFYSGTEPLMVQHGEGSVTWMERKQRWMLQTHALHSVSSKSYVYVYSTICRTVHAYVYQLVSSAGLPAQLQGCLYFALDGVRYRIYKQ